MQLVNASLACAYSSSLGCGMCSLYLGLRALGLLVEGFGFSVWAGSGIWWRLYSSQLVEGVRV